MLLCEGLIELLARLAPLSVSVLTSGSRYSEEFLRVLIRPLATQLFLGAILSLSLAGENCSSRKEARE